jgi:Protein of unknown function (DUF3244).
MKKINFYLKHFLLLALCIISAQSIFAVDVPLKNGETGMGGIGTNKVTTLKTVTYSPVSATLLVPDLYVDFSTSVGIATISIIDNTNNTVYQVSIDTFITPEVTIPVDTLNSGKYTLKVSYGSTVLTGTFQL